MKPASRAAQEGAFPDEGGPGHADGFLCKDAGDIPRAVAEEDAPPSQFRYFPEQSGIGAFFRSQCDDAYGSPFLNHFFQSFPVVGRFFGIVGICKEEQMPCSGHGTLQFPPARFQPGADEDASAHGGNPGDAGYHFLPVRAQTA